MVTQVTIYNIYSFRSSHLSERIVNLRAFKGNQNLAKLSFLSATICFDRDQTRTLHEQLQHLMVSPNNALVFRQWLFSS